MKTIDILNKISKEDFQDIINNSRSLSDVIVNTNLRLSTSTFKIVKNFIQDNNFTIDKNIWAINARKRKAKNLSLDRFCEGSSAHRGSLKAFMIKHELKEYKCEWCGLADGWNNKKLVLVLDHINGIPNDNRLENLRFLCPNCNSQTDTFTGKNQKRETKLNHCACGKIICKRSLKCNKCQRTKITKPSKEELEKLVWEIPSVEIAKLYKTTDTNVVKWCKSYDIAKPPRGYWNKKNAKGRSFKQRPTRLCEICQNKMIWRTSKKCRECWKSNTRLKNNGA